MRRWWLGILAGTVLTAGAVWTALPWLSVTAVRQRCPLPLADGARLVGAGWGSEGPDGNLLLQVDPATAWAVATAASGRWFPARCLKEGQRAWGQTPGGVPWRLELDAHAAPRLQGSLTETQGAALVAALRPPGAPWDVGLRALTLRSLPPEDGEPRLAVEFRGHLDVAGFQLDIEHLAGEVRLTATREVRARIDDLRLVGGDGDLLRSLVAQALGKVLTPQAQVAPSWVPWQTQVDVRLGSPLAEL